MAVVPLVWAAMSIVVIAAAISRSAFSRITSRLQVQGVRGLNPARRGFGTWPGGRDSVESTPGKAGDQALWSDRRGHGSRFPISVWDVGSRRAIGTTRCNCYETSYSKARQAIMAPGPRVGGGSAPERVLRSPQRPGGYDRSRSPSSCFRDCCCSGPGAPCCS